MNHSRIITVFCVFALAFMAVPLCGPAQTTPNRTADPQHGEAISQVRQPAAPRQTDPTNQRSSGTTGEAARTPTFGYINYNNVLQAMADYALAQQTMQNLRQQYDKEAAYNEDKFFKMYSDYIQGQKSFPQDIMLKRQKELQVAMDQGIAFRQQSEKNLEKAEQELLEPIRQKLDAAISTVAREKGYAFVLNTAGHACPYINPLDGTDITLMVEAVLSAPQRGEALSKSAGQRHEVISQVR